MNGSALMVALAESCKLPFPDRRDRRARWDPGSFDPVADLERAGVHVRHSQFVASSCDMPFSLNRNQVDAIGPGDRIDVDPLLHPPEVFAAGDDAAAEAPEKFALRPKRRHPATTLLGDVARSGRRHRPRCR